MKTTTPNSIKITLVIFCLFMLGNTYSQVKTTTNKTLFGKPVIAKNANPNNGIIRCATVEYEQYLQGKNPKRMSNAQFETWLAPLVKKQIASRTSSKTAGTVIITIPVVVHVIHNGQEIGVAPNITDAQVESQITILNQDFRKILNTPGGTNPIAADIEIEFVLAKVDPYENPTNGIDRVAFIQESWAGRGTDIDLIVKPATIWDPTQYLNMWTFKISDDILGYAQFPDNDFLPTDPNYLEGLGTSGGDSNTDGVISNYAVFGSSDISPSFLLASPYDKGRTMTHEVGHFLGLRHIWGDGGSRDSGTKNCTASDYCADTPQAGWENYDCPVTPYDSCPTDPGNDMVENYMDYTNDACMNIFTQNQKDRITVIMNNAVRRFSLSTSTKDTAIPLFEIDAEVKLECSSPAVICAAIPNQTTQKITIYNRGTNDLTSATINYNINGGSNIAYNWSGNLAINKSATFPITINSASNGTINITSISSANGVTDQRSTNNTTSGTFIIPIAPSNYAYTSYEFSLQRDLWGSETTWDLKDSTGAVLNSSGIGYSDKPTLPLPDLITETWTLANNQCYTFTINDSSGDGICCDGGNGYYNIKTNNGAIILTSGASFTSSNSKIFTTNTLGTDKFETSNDIYLYPNPTKGTLNIHVPSDFGLPNSFAISNSLGQIISRKKVSKQDDLIVNTSTLSNGVYFITVVKEDQKKTLQFIKE